MHLFNQTSAFVVTIIIRINDIEPTMRTLLKFNLISV